MASKPYKKPSDAELAKKYANWKPPAGETEEQTAERIKRYSKGGPFADLPAQPRPKKK